MIEVFKINGMSTWINNEKILRLEEGSDTVVIFENGERLLVKDTVEEIAKKILRLKQLQKLGDLSG